MEDLKVAMAGAGFWARYQLAAWDEVPGVRVVGVCDRDRAKAARLAAERGVAAVYDDAEEMIARERPDLLDVVTSVPGHAPLVRLAASRGVAVLCQKPMAADLDECEALVAECRRAGVGFAVHENWRWQAPLRHVGELIAGGAIGEVFRARIDMISGFDVFANQPGLRDDERFILADLGCHLFDLARYYLGEADSIACLTRRVRPEIRGEDAATALVGFGGGRAMATISMAYAGTPLERECFPQTLVFVEGDRGSIEVDTDYRVRVTTADGTLVKRVAPPNYPWADPAYAVVHASLVPCLTDAAKAVREGTRAETDAADNLRTMRLVFAAYESAATGRTIAMPREDAS